MEHQWSHGSSSGIPMKNGVLTSRHMELLASGSRLQLGYLDYKLDYDLKLLFSLMICSGWDQSDLIACGVMAGDLTRCLATGST